VVKTGHAMANGAHFTQSLRHVRRLLLMNSLTTTWSSSTLKLERFSMLYNTIKTGNDLLGPLLHSFLVESRDIYA
jgi:hypothetical protein